MPTWCAEATIKKGTNAVDAKANLVALCRLLERLGAHEASIVEEAVKPLLLREEALCGGLGLVQVAQVEVEKDQRA